MKISWELGEVKGAGGPGARITDQLLDVRVVVGRVCFVAGLYEDDFAVTASPGHDTSANFAAVKPTKIYDIIGFWNINKFSVAFFLF